MSGPVRSTSSLVAELNQLRENLENAYRRVQVVENRLRAQSRKGSAARTVEVFDVFGPAERPASTPAPVRRAPAESAWPVSRTDAPVLSPTPGLANLTLTGETLPVVGFSVCGFPRDELDRIVELVATKHSSDRNFIPVFLTDVMAADVFRRRRYVFEYFPGAGAERRLPGTRSWEEYARERLALIKRKYGISRIISFGKRGFCES